MFSYAEFLRDVIQDVRRSESLFRRAERLEAKVREQKGATVRLKSLTIGAAIDVLAETDDDDMYSCIHITGGAKGYVLLWSPSHCHIVVCVVFVWLLLCAYTVFRYCLISLSTTSEYRNYASLEVVVTISTGFCLLLFDVSDRFFPVTRILYVFPQFELFMLLHLIRLTLSRNRRFGDIYAVNAKTLATLSVPAHHIIGQPFSILFPHPIGDWVNAQLVQYASTGAAPLFTGAGKLLPIMSPTNNMFFMGVLQVNALALINRRVCSVSTSCGIEMGLVPLALT